MPKSGKKQEDSFFERYKKAIFIALAAILGLSIFLIFIFLNKDKSLKKSLINLEALRPPLGKDTLSILDASDKLQKSGNYHVTYNVTSLSTLEATSAARFTRVERKKGNNLRIDTYLSGHIPATSYFVNAEGKFFCSFLQEEAQCVELTEKIKSRGKASDREILASWIKNGAVKEKIDSQTIKIGQDDRTCDRVETTLIGKNISSKLLEEVTELIPDKPAEEDTTKTKEILDKLTVVSSNCYDRETGLPLTTIRNTTFGNEKQTSTQTVDFLSASPRYIEKLSARNIISSDSTTYRLLRSIEADGEIIYMGGEKGLYLVKDGKLIKHDQEINRTAGDIYDLILYKGKMYMGASRGLFSQSDGKWVQDIDTLKTWEGRDFIEYKNTLFAATGNGVFVLEKNTWTQPNSSFKDMGKAGEFAVTGGNLYTVTDKGLYKYREGKWDQLYEDNKFGKRMLFSDKEYLLVSTASAVLNIKDDKPSLVADWKTTGDVFDTISFNGNVYVAGRKGIYSTDKKYVLDAETIGYGRDFFVFQNKLYAGTDAGVYRLEDYGWNQVSNEDIGEIDTFSEKDGVLYAGGLLGIYRFDGSSWVSGPVTDVNEFYSSGDHLYVISNNRTFLNEVSEVAGDIEMIFNLPKEAKIVKP